MKVSKVINKEGALTILIDGEAASNTLTKKLTGAEGENLPETRETCGRFPPERWGRGAFLPTGRQMFHFGDFGKLFRFKDLYPTTMTEEQLGDEYTSRINEIRKWVAECRGESNRDLLKYHFSVDNRENFDFRRIYREVKEDHPKAVGFIIRGPKNAALSLYVDFLSNFTAGDKISVMGEFLSERWGWGDGGRGWENRIKIEDDRLRQSFVPSDTTTARVRNTIIATEEVSRAKKEVEAAQNFRRKIVITVNVL